jgi:hypothetical protein
MGGFQAQLDRSKPAEADAGDRRKPYEKQIETRRNGLAASAFE